jgi:hypothetical protein
LPKQSTLVCALKLLASAAEGWVITTLRVRVHPFASVTVQVHVPAGKPVAVAEFWTGVVFHA